MCILWSLCVYCDLYVYTVISMDPTCVPLGVEWRDVIFSDGQLAAATLWSERREIASLAKCLKRQKRAFYLDEMTINVQYPGLFFVFLSLQLRVNKNWRILESNWRSLVLEMAALPTNCALLTWQTKCFISKNLKMHSDRFLSSATRSISNNFS